MKLGDLDTQGPLLDARQIADRLGVTLSTWQAYVSRGQAPPPDTYAVRTPLWLESTIDTWINARKGNP